MIAMAPCFDPRLAVAGGWFVYEARTRHARPARARAPRSRGLAAKARRQAGITLIELMMVIVIIGLAASGLTFSLGALSRASLKSAAGRLAAASRYAYNRAVVQGTTDRMGCHQHWCW